MNDQQQSDQMKPEQDNLASKATAVNIKDDTDTSALYLGTSSLQTQAEFLGNKKSDHSKEDSNVTSSGVDDQQSDSVGIARTDRAGTRERKQYGDIELNKGLEAQAKDEEL